MIKMTGMEYETLPVVVDINLIVVIRSSLEKIYFLS